MNDGYREAVTHGLAIIVRVGMLNPFITWAVWKWCVMPTTGFKEISYWQALGIGLCIISLVITAKKCEDKQ